MIPIRKNNYYVVQFKDLPYDDIEKYIIIPYSWIRICRSSGSIKVAFPKEDPKKTRQRVEKNQKHGLNWQVYEAIVKFDSSSYNDADIWISTMKNGPPEIQRVVVVEKKKSESPDVSKKNNKNILLLPKKRYRNIDVEIKSPIVNDGHSHKEAHRLSPPRINNPESTVQNAPVLMNQPDRVAEQSSEKLYPDTFDCQQQQQQRHSTQSVIIKSPRSGEKHKENLRSTTSPVQCIPKLEDQTIRRSPEVKKNSPSHVQEVPRSLKFLSAGSSGTPHLQEVTKNTPTPAQSLPTQPNTPHNRKPIVRGFLLQDPMTETVFLRKFPKPVTVQNTTVSSSSSEQDLSAKQAFSPKPDQSCEPVQKKQFSDASDNSSDQEIFTKHLPVKKFKPNYDKSSDGSKCIPQQIPSTKNNFPITTKISIESKKMAEKMLMNEFDTIFKKIDSVIDNKDEAPLTVRNALYEYYQIFLTTIRDVNSYCEQRNQELKLIKKPQTKPAVSSLPEDTTVTRGINQQISNSDNHDDKADKTTKKPRFSLPPDYDPRDTRWTLKYREPGSGTVELIPHSNVYIKPHRLAYCKLVARDCKTLARMLLMEIFSLSALSVCSLTGARAKVFDLDGSDVRPGLDEHARSVLLTFVEEYGIRNRWRVFDTQSILNSIRSKIQEIRSKHGSIIH